MSIIEVEPTVSLKQEDTEALSLAVHLLEHTSLAARLTNLVGRKIELAGFLVPEKAKWAASHAASLAMRAALKMALRSLDARHKLPTRGLHRAMAAASGAAGGAFGLAALPVELPTSTMVMLRAIADVARSEGENLRDPEVALACLQVFALGGRNVQENHLESSYFAIRGLLARTVSEAARYMVGRSIVDESAPALVRLVSAIAARFGMVVTQKVAAQAIPVLGALGGAAVNYAFVDHFQSLAQGHFIMRRLERKYGAQVVRAEYEKVLMKDVSPNGRTAK